MEFHSKHATCSHGLTGKYRRYRQNLLDKQVKMNYDYENRRKKCCQPPDHYVPEKEHKDSQSIFYKKLLPFSGKFQSDMDKYLLHVKKKDLPQICAEKLVAIMNYQNDSSDDEISEWDPHLPSPPVSSHFSTSSNSQGSDTSQGVISQRLTSEEISKVITVQ